MIEKEQNGVRWLEFELLQELPVAHGIFLRHGGGSAAPYDTLNLALGVGDNEEAVRSNHQKVKEILPFNTLHWGEQVHGISIKQDVGEEEQAGCDGLFTNKQGRGLMAKHADCQAAIIYDPLKHALMVIHAGWRGSVKNIYANAIKLMIEVYRSNPADLFVGISPSLGPDAAEFVNYRDEIPEQYWDYRVGENCFDFWTISQEQLMDAGILPNHLEIAHICTYENESDYFSYRRNKTTGRHGTIAMLR